MKETIPFRNTFRAKEPFVDLAWSSEDHDTPHNLVSTFQQPITRAVFERDVNYA